MSRFTTLRNLFIAERIPALFATLVVCALAAGLLLTALSADAQGRGGGRSSTCISWVQDTYIEGYTMQFQPGDQQYDGELQVAAAGGYSCNGGSCTRAVTTEYAYAQIDAGAEECSFGSAVPTVDLSATPTTVYSGSSSNLSWSSTDADSCTGTGFSTGGATSGSVVTGALTSNQNYVLSCTGAGGSASDTATVTVTQPPISVSLTASPSTINSGGSSTLSWTSNNAGSCIGNGFATNAATSGSTGTGSLTETTDYLITCVAQTGVSGTWHLRDTEISDLSCPVVLPTNVARNVPNCPSNPQGKNCSAAGLACKINTDSSNQGGGGCFVTTQFYVCEGESSNTISAVDTARVTVVAPTAPTATLTANPTNVASGSASNLSWSSTNATSCTGTGFSTGGATSSGTAVSTGALTADTSYTLTCTGAGGSATDSETVTVTPPTAQGPNLTASGVSPGSAEKDQATTLSATISNAGTSATGGGFTNLFQFDNDTDHAAVVTTHTDTSPNLPPNGTDSSQVSYTFGTTGTWYVRACADNNASFTGTIAESVETDNCGSWTPVVVTGPACTGAGCDPGSASLSCSVSNTSPILGQSVTYTATPSGSAHGPYVWTASDGATGLGTGSTATRSFATAGTYGMSVSAASGQSTTCLPLVTAGGCSGTAQVTIDANPTRVRQDSGTFVLTWTAQNTSASTCTITGTDGLSITRNPSSCSVGPETGAPRTITTQTTYTITCGTATDSVTVNVLPKVIEF